MRFGVFFAFKPWYSFVTSTSSVQAFVVKNSCNFSPPIPVLHITQQKTKGHFQWLTYPLSSSFCSSSGSHSLPCSPRGGCCSHLLISRAQTRVEKTPWGTFWMGLVVVIAVTIPDHHPARASFWTCQIHRLGIDRGFARAFIHRFRRHRCSFGQAAHKSEQSLRLERIYPRLCHPRTRRILSRHRLVLHLAAHAHHGLRRNRFCLAQLDAAREDSNIFCNCITIQCITSFIFLLTS